MSPRVVSALAAAAGLALLAFGPPRLRGQSKTVARATKSSIPRTPDGHPDLHGFWTNSTFTPLERPAELAGKEFFTQAEAAEFEKQRLIRENSQSKEDIHYDNALWQTENWSRVSNPRTSIVFDPPDGKLPPLNASGQKHAAELKKAAKLRDAAISAETRNLAERCIAWGNEGPPMLGSTYNANMEIVQTPGLVLVSHEIIHGARVIPLDGRPHLPAGVRQLGGDSRGKWEGDTLVVESTNFTNQTNFRGPPATARQDIFSSQDLRVVERFTLTAPDTIVYRFTMQDPSTWDKPWSGELLMRKTEGPIYEYACHEGNRGLENILAGARVREKAAEKK